MALTLLVRSGEGNLRVTFDAPRIVVGRGEGCEVRLPDPSVSHRHASFRQRGSEYIVMDEGSSNGTFVGPVRLSAQAPRIVKSGDLVRVGRVWLEVLLEQALPTANGPMATREIALALVADGLAAEGSRSALRVEVVEGPGAGAELVLDAPNREYVVGRSPNIDLNVDDPDLSRRHLEISRRGDRVMVKDLGSKNGTQLGQRKLDAREEAPWPRGESVFIGKSRLVYEDPVGEALDQLESAADERMKENELVEPPNSPPLAASAPASRPAPASRNVRVGERIRSGGGEPGGWTPTDVLVALLAVIVLALSVAGLVWLMRTG